MTRRIVLFLALLLPLQFAWANAAAYCGHETPVQTHHFGHHEHAHEAGVGQSTGDSDCGTCHATSVPMIVDASMFVALDSATALVVPHAPPILPPALARAPDRPQWSCLVERRDPGRVV